MRESCFFRRQLLVPAIVITISSSRFIVPSESYVSPTRHPHESSSLVRLASNVASGFLSPSSDYQDPSPSKNDRKSGERSKRLSRPERKALERQRKQNIPTAGGKKRASKSSYQSNGVSNLNENSTAEDVMRAIKRAQNPHGKNDIRAITDFLLECDEGFAYGYRGSLLSRVAVAAMHVGDHVSARKALDTRTSDHKSTIDPMESAAIIRGLLRIHNVTQAMEVLDDELSIPIERAAIGSPASQERLKYRAASLASIASRHFFEGEPSKACNACQMLAELGPVVRESGLKATDINLPWLRIIKGAAQCETGRRDGTVKPCVGLEDVELPCNLVYSVLNAMTTFPSENDDRVFEALSNSLVRRVLFVTGAVDMSGCPTADRGEVAFIGRSNVGKSSLINMVTNRKSLAYTSKTPGKTQQFNFFAVNDKAGREKEIKYGDLVAGEKDRDSFYIVDLPGFGFAKVPEKQRQQWASFMQEYIQTRKSLRIVFHLIDSRHGPIDEDMSIMKQVGECLPKGVSYVVVMTKADKNVKGSLKTTLGKVSGDVRDKLREAMKANKVGNAPIILTSAETKLGRDDIWRYLRLAAES